MIPLEFGLEYSKFRLAKEQLLEEPWYFNLKNQVQAQLETRNNFIETPDFSEIASIPDLFARARHTSELVWQDAMSKSLDNVFQGYECKSEKGRQFIEGLNNKELLFKELADNRNWQFEALRKAGDGEIWFALVLALSKREQFKIKILQNWLSNISEADEVRWGISGYELKLYLGLNLELQPNIDDIYVQQMMISDEGTSYRRNPKEFYTTPGAALLYIYGLGYEEWYSFGEMFPTEIANIQEIFYKYANIVRIGIKEGRLGDKYQDLPNYLEFLGSTLGLSEISPEELDKLSDEYIALCIELGKLGCPIIVNPLGFIGEEGERVDMELLVGINLGEKSTWYKDSQVIMQIAKAYGLDVGLDDDEIVPIIHQIFLAVNGSNITYTSLASAGKYINFNDARHTEVGIDRHARYSHFMKNGMKLDRFIKAIGIGTITHEFGHLYFYPEDGVSKKMGTNINSNKYEELKADCIGSILFKKYLENGGKSITSSEYIEQYLLNYLDDILDAPDPSIDRSPSWYSFNGQTIIAELLDSESIDYVDGQFVIKNADLGVEILANLGEKILDSYIDPSFTSTNVDEFVISMEAKNKVNVKLQMFLKDLKKT